MIDFFFFYSVPRLLGVPCDKVSLAIVTQIKAMGSYKVRRLLKYFVPFVGWNKYLYIKKIPKHSTEFPFQLGPVTPFLIQANHTSALGQVESVNFTMISTSMSLGCHVEVKDVFLHLINTWSTQDDLWLNSGAKCAKHACFNYWSGFICVCILVQPVWQRH